MIEDLKRRRSERELVERPQLSIEPPELEPEREHPEEERSSGPIVIEF
jgi:hypothetical protein